MSKCLSCNHVIKKLNFNLNFISSDVDILKYRTSHAFCKHCGLLQKIINKDYIKKISQIYKKYLGFKKFKFNDQKKIIGNISLNRCEILYNKFLKNKKICNILDFGTSNGAMLHPFLKSKSNLFATDLKNNLDQELKSSKKFKKFINIKNLLQCKIKFDLITLIHVFEHLTKPAEVLKDLSTILHNNGKILIQIPNYKKNPVDLAIYDHTAHYDRQSIINFFASLNFNIDKLDTDLIFGETTIILSKNSKSKNIFMKVKPFYKKSLSEIKSKIKKIQTTTNFSILGTSINSIFFYSYFKKNVKTFFDEDAAKIGSKCCLKNVEQLQRNDNSIILIPFFGKKRKNIQHRIEKKFSYKLL